MKLLYLDTGELYLPIPTKSSTQIGGEAARAAQHDPCHPMAKVKQELGILITFMELLGEQVPVEDEKDLNFLALRRYGFQTWCNPRRGAGWSAFLQAIQ